MLNLIRCLVLLSFCTLAAYGQESVTFATPVKADPGATKFRVVTLCLDWLTETVSIQLQEAEPIGGIKKDGKYITCTYTGEEAVTLMLGLNKANLATKSLQRRVIERLQTDGKIGTGSVSGTPE